MKEGAPHPPIIELSHLYQASQAVELGKETTEDLRYLQGRGASLGGLRPKCTLIDNDGIPVAVVRRFDRDQHGGRITDIHALMAHAPYFDLNEER